VFYKVFSVTLETPAFFTLSLRASEGQLVWHNDSFLPSGCLIALWPSSSMSPVH